MCMLYLSPSLCYIDSLCNWHMNIKRSDKVYNILSKSVPIKGKDFKFLAQSQVSVIMSAVPSAIWLPCIYIIYECVFLLRLRSQTWGHGCSEARVAVQHTFDLLHIYKHVNRGGNCQIPIAITGIPHLPLVTCQIVNMVQCLDLQVVNNTSLLCFINNPYYPWIRSLYLSIGD